MVITYDMWLESFPTKQHSPPRVVTAVPQCHAMHSSGIRANAFDGGIHTRIHLGEITGCVTQGLDMLCTT